MRAWEQTSVDSLPASHPARRFVLGRQPAVRRELVDHLRQLLAHAVEQVVARHAEPPRHRVDVVATDRARQVAGRNLPVRPAADPGVGDVAQAVVLELLEQAAEPAAENAAGRRAAEQAAETALQQIAQPAARRGAGVTARQPPLRRAAREPAEQAAEVHLSADRPARTSRQDWRSPCCGPAAGPVLAAANVPARAPARRLRDRSSGRPCRQAAPGSPW